MDNRFIDYININQDHPEGNLPVIGEELFVTYDLETGDTKRGSITAKTQEGSYSTNLKIFCDGGRVRVTGNPSRYERRDNLFGLQTIEQVVEGVINPVINNLGLPSFTKCKTNKWYQGKDGRAATRVADGAVITRLDLTENYQVGKGNERAFLRGLSTQTVGRANLPYLYDNEATLVWSKNSTYRNQKLYIKAEEIRVNQLKKAINQEHRDHLEKVIHHCEQVGTVRHEIHFKRAFLVKNNLCFYGVTSLEQFKPYVGDIHTILERIEMNTQNYEMIADQLIKAGVVSSLQAAYATQAYGLTWMHGMPIDKSKSQYYKHLKRLRAIGIDISVPFNPTKKMPVIKNEREIIMQSMSIPDWYQMPRLASRKTGISVDVAH